MKSLYSKLRNTFGDITMNDLLTRYRRYFHANPELDDETQGTAEYIENELKKYSCTIEKPINGSVCAFFDCGKSETVAFRSDMDALPVRENTGLSFASSRPGVMHACGHDGHMAMVLALAGEVHKRRDTLPRNVLLVFQPSEETTGGAKRICYTGIFERHNVTRVFGFHIMPGVPKGVVAGRKNEMMAKSSEVNVRVSGVSAHIARSEEGADALYAAAEFVHRCYDMFENDLDKIEFKLLKFGKLTSGTARNAISADAELEGSLRCFSEEHSAFLRSRINDVAAKLERETGTEFEISYSEGYLPVRNDPELFELTAETLGDVLILDRPSMTAEDFSYYQVHAPGVLLFLGCGEGMPLHSDKFDFDEKILEKGLSTYLKLLEME